MLIKFIEIIHSDTKDEGWLYTLGVNILQLCTGVTKNSKVL